jgi:hypothetical protein
MSPMVLKLEVVMILITSGDKFQDGFVQYIDLLGFYYVVN